MQPSSCPVGRTRTHPITALQTELSLWERGPLEEILPTCRELGIGFVAYSPLGRGFLTGRFRSPSEFGEGDFRAALPRFTPDAMDKNQALVDLLRRSGVAAVVAGVLGMPS